METKNGSNLVRNALIISLFSVGAVIGFGLLLISVWGDIEASMFDVSYQGEQRLTTLACPVFLTPKETGEFTAKIKNPIERKIHPSVRVHISDGYLTLMSEENVKFELAPNESRKVAWTVDPEDATYGKMVLVKVFLFPDHPIPSKDASCGIYVIDLPAFSGGQILYGGMGLSFIAMIGSIGYWRGSNRVMTKRQREAFRTMTILAGAIILGVIASLMGWWMVGSIGIVVAVLMTMMTITQAI